MKKTIALTLMATAMAGSIFASGAQDEITVTGISKSIERSEASSVEQVFPSSDILDVFSDNDDDDLYDSTLPFLKGYADRHELTQSQSDYISEIILNDTDDVMELIRDELKAELTIADNAQAYMVLGNYKITADVQKTAGEATRITYNRDLVGFTPVETVQVEASEDVLTVFTDNDDDDVFSGLTDRNSMTKDSADYISQIIADDTDDISEVIFDELKAVLTSGSVERSEMVLGNHKFTATLEAPKVYKLTSEEVFYSPATVAVINASDDILSIFSDNDDDDLYESALPYLTGKADTASMPVEVNDYITSIIYEDFDDLNEEIYNELTEAFSESDSESVTLKLGSYNFTLSMDYMS